MITPSLRGGNEVTQPVYVDGAEPGDGIAGRDSSPDGFCLGDPYVAARCPACDEVWPETHLEGIGQDAVKCDKCGNAVTPFEIVHGYTVVFDETRRVGVTVPREAAETIARDPYQYAALPDGSVQHPILAFAPSDMAGASLALPLPARCRIRIMRAISARFLSAHRTPMG